MSERDRKDDRAQTAETAATGSKPSHVGDMDVQPRHSTAGNLDPTVRGELPSDRHGAGTAERQRDPSAGLGRGLPHEGADIPGPETVGGEEPAARAGREIIEALEDRPETNR